MSWTHSLSHGPEFDSRVNLKTRWKDHSMAEKLAKASETIEINWTGPKRFITIKDQSLLITYHVSVWKKTWKVRIQYNNFKMKQKTSYWFSYLVLGKKMQRKKMWSLRFFSDWVEMHRFDKSKALKWKKRLLSEIFYVFCCNIKILVEKSKNMTHGAK